MPVDTQIRQFLDLLATMDAPAINQQTPAQARAAFRKLSAMKPATKATVARVHDTTCEGPGGPITLRVYTPPGTAPHPLLVYFHGGGFVIGDLDSHDGACRELSAGAGCVVVSVDYRLAPEHRFPAAVEDCLTATRWAAEQAAELGVDTHRIAVGGDSAGGNLAAVAARHCRDADGPALCAQLLIYPVTDHYSRETPSLRDNAEGYLLTRDAMVWFADHYLRGPADTDHPDAAPLHADSLRDLPPVWLCTAEFDPLRDEGEAYGRRLQTAGVDTTMVRYHGAIHGIYTSASMLKLGQRMMDDSCAWLRARFAS